MYCNGARLNGKFMQDVIDAGIDFVRFGMIGYNKELYKKWMNIDNFDLIKSNIKEIKEYILKKSTCNISTYHLITDNNNIDFEISEYKKIANELKTTSYVWKMHNWSGNFNNPNKRSGSERRYMWKPFARDNNQGWW